MTQGESAFYSGNIADRIVAEMKANNGLITKQDLANYRTIERQPVTGEYRGHKIVSMPPPSSGGVHLVQMLNVLSHFPIQNMGYGSSAAIHHMTEAMKWAYADRSQYLGDPDYVEVPVNELTSQAYAAEIADKINPQKAIPASQIKPGP